MVSRRSLLLGGGATVAAGAIGYAAEGQRIRRALHVAPSSPHEVPDVATGQVLSGSFRSTAMQTTTGWSICYPHGYAPGSRLPVLLELHGRGDDHRDPFVSHRLDSFLSAAVRAGTPPYAIVSVDGGTHTYWHRRRSGEDPQAMILTELLPLLAAHGLRITRLALGGWSMGGYGALLLAQRLGPSVVAAVAVDSPALWKRYGDTAGGAFDDSADFRGHDVLAASGRLAGIPLRVSCGSADPFLPGVLALLAAIPTAERDVAPGGHDVAWWKHAAPQQLAFVGKHLAD